MPVVRVEHPVGDFAAWKQAFDSDPIGRARMGVRRHEILRSLDDPNYVMVDLEVDTAERAEELRRALEELWHRVQAQGLIGEQQARVADIVEVREY
jgi:hypothetical protein